MKGLKKDQSISQTANIHMYFYVSCIWVISGVADRQVWV